MGRIKRFFGKVKAAHAKVGSVPQKIQDYRVKSLDRAIDREQGRVAFRKKQRSLEKLRATAQPSKKFKSAGPFGSGDLFASPATSKKKKGQDNIFQSL